MGGRAADGARRRGCAGGRLGQNAARPAALRATNGEVRERSARFEGLGLVAWPLPSSKVKQKRRPESGPPLFVLTVFSRPSGAAKLKALCFLFHLRTRLGFSGARRALSSPIPAAPLSRMAAASIPAQAS